MMSYHTVYDVICAKNTCGMIYHTEVLEETFNVNHVNSKIAQTNEIFKSLLSESRVYN